MPGRFFRPRPLVALFITVLVPSAAAAQAGAAPSAETLFAALGIREGQTVCEVGAGSGSLSIAAAKIVGSTGRVYTSELGETRVQKLRAAVAASGLQQVTVVAGEAEGTNFPDQACDALFMRDVYHHFTDPAAMNAAVHAALKSGGRVAVVDFRPPGEDAAPAERAKNGTHGVLPDTVVREMEAAGFEPVSTESGGRWFMVVLAKKGAASFSGNEEPQNR
jgi:ubiquinone/menaquinone biosynthesis C-methylase UbiE